MGTGFIRRYLADPGAAELTAIEGVVIIDREPPASITGVGSGCALIVGEFEDGEFETPTEVSGGSDLVATFGGFGYTYDGIGGNNPCARTRRSDGAIVDEYWNGNGFLALVNKRFRRLIVCRVDTSVGEVSFTRLASLSGSSNFTFDLEPGELVAVKIDGAAAVNATFTATAGTRVSAAGTYPSAFIGGETLTFAIDGAQYVATFLAGDQTQAQVIARLNAAAGYTAFVDSGAGVTTLTGRQRGTGGSVQIVAVSAVVVTTATGFSAGAAAAGTGNVANIDQVTVTEANTVISGAVASARVDRDAAGKVRIYNAGTPGTGTIELAATTTATGFGWALSTEDDAAVGEDGVIPAGTRVQTAGAVVFVTMQTIDVSSTSAGPYTVKVRHALDDGSGTSAGVAAITTVTAPIALGAFEVTNDLGLSAALSESAIDAQYVLAMAKTSDITSVVKEANLMWSARSSNAVRSTVRSTVLDASANGCYGRLGFIRPPLKTTRVVAKSTTSQPGVGAYRDQRIVYCYPGVQTYVPQIALRGTAGGAGFTADGLIDTGFDSWAVALCSQLPPEENPGQETPFLSGITAIEAGNSDVQGMVIGDYRAFRAAGIAAPRIDGGVAFMQSGVTSVDPLVYPNLKNIARRRMADFIQDTLALRLLAFGKKLATKQRRALVIGEINGFMSGLRSADNPSLQRIEDYLLDGLSANTADAVAAGIYRIKLKVRTLSSLDVIVLDTEIGESVVVKEAA